MISIKILLLSLSFSVGNSFLFFGPTWSSHKKLDACQYDMDKIYENIEHLALSANEKTLTLVPSAGVDSCCERRDILPPVAITTMNSLQSLIFHSYLPLDFSLSPQQQGSTIYLNAT